MFSGHFAVVGAVDDQRVFGQPRLIQLLEHLADDAVKVLAHSKIGCPGHANAFFGQRMIEVSQAFQLADSRRCSLCLFRRWLRNIYPIVIIFEKFLCSGDIGAVRENKASHSGKGTISLIMGLLVQIIKGRRNDHVIIRLIGTHPITGIFYAHAALPRYTQGHFAKQGSALQRNTGVMCAPFANGPSLKSVPLIRSNKVHTSNQGSFIAGCAHAMCPGGDGRRENMAICPDAVRGGRSGCHKSHPAGYAKRRCAIGVVEPYAFGSKPVHMWGSNHFIAITSDVKFAVLIGHDHQNIGSICHMNPLHYATTCRSSARQFSLIIPPASGLTWQAWVTSYPPSGYASTVGTYPMEPLV